MTSTHSTILTIPQPNLGGCNGPTSLDAPRYVPRLRGKHSDELAKNAFLLPHVYGP